MRPNLSVRLARLEAGSDRGRIRYIVSSRVLSDGEWQQVSDIAGAEDSELEAVMTEAEWVTAHCDQPEINRQ